MLDVHTSEFNYTEISPPLIVNEDVMFGTVSFQNLKMINLKLNLKIQVKNFDPTAEVVLTNLVRKSLLNKDELPKRFVASTPCFRKEAAVMVKTPRG